MPDLHHALRVERVRDVQNENIDFGRVRLTYGKDDVAYSVHTRPHQWSGGIQSTDILSLMGFSREPCPIYDGECYVAQVAHNFRLEEFASAFVKAKYSLRAAEGHLQQCGLLLPTPEGRGYFDGKPSGRRSRHLPLSAGDGHSASKLDSLKLGEDDFFLFRMTFGYFGDTKGWVFHYRPRNPPFTPEIRAAMQFLDAFHQSPQCPEFDFEPCVWRFVEFEEDEEDGPSGRNTDYAHRSFDAHPEHFSQGLKDVLDAHAALAPFGLSFLSIRPLSTAQRPPLPPQRPVARQAEPVPGAAQPGTSLPASFDVAVSFAGTERSLAHRLAEIVREAGFVVFYDDFYPEHLWGKDLVVFFDEIYGQKARYCVIFISREYLDRVWTNHERQSAQAKALGLKGEEYILPVRVDDSELSGLPRTVGYLSIDDHPIEEIAELLIRKLRSS